MKHYFHIANTNLVLQSNRSSDLDTSVSIKAYTYTTASPYYTTAEASPITAVGDTDIAGKYYFDVTTTGKYTCVITKDDATLQVLDVKKWMEGNDEVQNPVT